MNFDPENTKHVTVLLKGGLISPEKMEAINAAASKYNVTYYLTTAQNLRILGLNESNLDAVKKSLTDSGLQLKAPGQFPLPKVCVGKPFCNLGLADTFALSDKILEAYGSRTEVKPKYKISISGCPASCGGSHLADIGIVTTKNGYDLYVGGKGGPLPRRGDKVAKGLSEDEVIEAIGKVVDFHAANTPKKLRMYKLLDKPGFPFPVEK